ncbi:hypothetical protein F2P56_001856 [Juglans regia]|uniref:Reverse transcriptase Ty1/copia-type domain-containing protein n=1 Tax=Juglans regia TaxID=51240 RepID=A0A833YBA5_JUGRE|nr:hypothetical protein F2P56_001856 [Juglans regia]
MTGNSKPRVFPDFNVFYSTRHPLQVLSTVITSNEPSTYTQAVSSPAWRAAMGNEFDALMVNGTCVKRYKARLVAKGFDQKYGVDYAETFSPVVKHTTVRMILALAVSLNWNIRQLDISNVFLHGSLDEEVFMEQPQGFVDENHPDYVCRLHKSLYGLKQAPRAWFRHLSQSLLEYGFIESTADYSLFIYATGSVKFYVLVYVDDILVIGSSKFAIDSFVSSLMDSFLVKDLGELSFFLGVQACRDQHGLHLRQARYITDLLESTKMVGAKPLSCPTISGPKLSTEDGELLSDPTEYRRVVGAFNTVQSRALTLHMLSTNCANSCTIPMSPIGLLLSVCFAILRVVLIMVFILLLVI